MSRPAGAVNLLLNAIEAMSEAPGEVTVSSRREPLGGVVVTVSDEGAGLPGGSADRIFDAFYTTKAARDAATGPVGGER